MAIVTIMTQTAGALTISGEVGTRKGVILRAIGRGSSQGISGTGLAFEVPQRRHDGS
jgi:hypothetical protein